MLKLPVAAGSPDMLPAIALQQPYDFADLH
jgi:hypothetical protein